MAEELDRLNAELADRYRIERAIGSGGMATVYLAEDLKHGRKVALKVLRPELTALLGPERFQREIEVTGKLAHPHILPLYDSGTADDSLYYVMPYIEGESLRERLNRQKQLPVAEAIQIAREVADALDYAHRQDVIHRDIKPENILLQERHAVVADFGIARAIDRAGGEQLTRTGVMLGTPPYMSPEQAGGAGQLDGRSDLYSLGCVLHEMLAGQTPYTGPTAESIIHQHMNAAPPDVRSLRPSVPHELPAMLQRALAKVPADRFGTGTEFGEALAGAGGRVEPVKAPKRPRGHMVGVAVAAVALVVVATILFRGGLTPVESPSLDVGRTIGVMGFENLSDPDDVENLSRVLIGLVNTDLAESGGLKIVSTAKVMGAIREAGGDGRRGFDAAIAPAAARLAGVEIMLVGQVTQIGEQLVLAAELVDVKSGNALGSLKHEAASSSELFALAGVIADGVRRQLGVTKATASFNLARALTNSPGAYRWYAEGEQALHEQSFENAARLFSRATEEDSTFALAYYRLGLARSWNGDDEGAEKGYRLAQRYGDRLPNRWRTVIQAQADYHAGAIDRAYGALTHLVESASDIPDAYNTLGEILTHSFRYLDVKKAREYFETALEIDPTFKIVFTHLLQDYIWAGDFEAYEQLLSRYRKENPGDGAVKWGERNLLRARREFKELIRRTEEDLAHGYEVSVTTRAVVHLGIGDWDRAEALADEGIQAGVGSMVGLSYWCRGLARIAKGSLRSGLSDLEVVKAHLTENEAKNFTSFSNEVRAVVLVEAGDLDGARNAASKAIAANPYYGGGYHTLGFVLASSGQTRELDEILSRLIEVSKQSFSPEIHFWVRLLAAEKYLATGDISRARIEVEAASAMPPEHRTRQRESLVRARVLTAAGDRTGAIAAYREFLEHPYLGFVTDWWVQEISALYPLARLEEEEGDLASARNHYRRYLASWGKADVPIANVPDARARLDRLVAAVE